MNQIRSIFSAILAIGLLSACEEQVSQNEIFAGDKIADQKSWVVLEESLQQLKDDFNANKDKVRLLFIVGDTCGICLRGMADLNDAFIARAQNDERLLTLVVHVPVLGAQEKHVPDAIPLLDGPRVLHYWDEVGKSGIHFGDSLETDGMYAWDVWLAYGPDDEWMETVPPRPEFWMHQLGPLDPDLKLDAELFAEKSLALMNDVKAGDFAELAEDEGILLADGTVIPSVVQPASVAVRQHIRGTGGYQNLKSINLTIRTGSINWGSQSVSIEITQDREQGLSPREN